MPSVEDEDDVLLCGDMVVLGLKPEPASRDSVDGSGLGVDTLYCRYCAG